MQTLDVCQSCPLVVREDIRTNKITCSPLWVPACC